MTNKDVAEVAQLKARLATAMRANQMHKKRIASFARSEQVREAAVKAVLDALNRRLPAVSS